MLKNNPTLATITVVLLLLLTQYASAQSIKESSAGFFDDTFGDLGEEITTAEDEDKFGLMIMFETEDCPWCIRMKQRILNRVTVQNWYREHFRIIALNAEGDTMITDFSGQEMISRDFALKHLRVRATPVFAFFDLTGKLVARYTGALKSVEEFMLLGKYVTDGHYKNGRFSKFKKLQRKS